jgi:hypothetical protein
MGSYLVPGVFADQLKCAAKSEGNSNQLRVGAGATAGIKACLLFRITTIDGGFK